MLGVQGTGILSILISTGLLTSGLGILASSMDAQKSSKTNQEHLKRIQRLRNEVQGILSDSTLCQCNFSQLGRPRIRYDGNPETLGRAKISFRGLANYRDPDRCTGRRPVAQGVSLLPEGEGLFVERIQLTDIFRIKEDNTSFGGRLTINLRGDIQEDSPKHKEQIFLKFGGTYDGSFLDVNFCHSQEEQVASSPGSLFVATFEITNSAPLLSNRQYICKLNIVTGTVSCDSGLTSTPPTFNELGHFPDSNNINVESYVKDSVLTPIDGHRQGYKVSHDIDGDEVELFLSYDLALNGNKINNVPSQGSDYGTAKLVITKYVESSQ